MIRNRIFAILFLIVGYTAIKAVELMPSSPWRATALGLGVFVIMFSWQFLAHHKTMKVNDRLWFRILAWVGSFTMAIWSIFIPLSFVTDLVYGLLVLASPAMAKALGHFDFRDLELIVLTSSCVLAFAGYIVAVILGPQLRNVSVSIENLPPSLHGFKIAQVSDVHVGSTVRRRYVERLVAQTNAVGADIVAVTGDLVDGWAEELALHLEPFSELRARHGVFYVPGNHEYYWDAPKLIEKVVGFGFRPLINESAVVDLGEALVFIGGITDPAGKLLSAEHVPNVQRAAQAKVDKPHVRILLSHRPNFYQEAEEHGFHLQLSGHTHGGQYFPYSWIVRFIHKFHRGLNRYGRLAVYVNPGSGYWALANRLGVRAEITVIHLSAQ